MSIYKVIANADVENPKERDWLVDSRSSILKFAVGTTLFFIIGIGLSASNEKGSSARAAGDILSIISLFLLLLNGSLLACSEKATS